MTPQEFKAWFEGFSEGITDKPTIKQWQRICKRVKEVDGTPISYPVYVDRWVKPYWRPWCDPPIVYYGMDQNSVTTSTLNAVGTDQCQAALPTLQEIGKAEFQSLKGLSS